MPHPCLTAPDRIGTQSAKPAASASSSRFMRRRSAWVSASRATFQLVTTCGSIALRGMPLRVAQIRRARLDPVAKPDRLDEDRQHRDGPDTGQPIDHASTLVQPRCTVCSIAPKIEWPALSFISMRTVSPKRRNGVFGAPCSNRLDRAQLGDAGIAGAALGDRLARAAVELVGDRARADDRAGGERPGLRGMGDQLRKIEGHVDAGIGAAERLAVEVDVERQAAACRRPRRRPARRASPRPAKRPRTAWTGRSRTPWRARPGSGRAG